MASDLGLYCLHMSHKKDAMLIWVKVEYQIIFSPKKFGGQEANQNADLISIDS